MDYSPIMENQMEKKMENALETWIILGSYTELFWDNGKQSGNY